MGIGGVPRHGETGVHDRAHRAILRTRAPSRPPRRGLQALRRFSRRSSSLTPFRAIRSGRSRSGSFSRRRTRPCGRSWRRKCRRRGDLGPTGARAARQVGRGDARAQLGSRPRRPRKPLLPPQPLAIATIETTKREAAPLWTGVDDRCARVRRSSSHASHLLAAIEPRREARTARHRGVRVGGLGFFTQEGAQEAVQATRSAAARAIPEKRTDFQGHVADLRPRSHSMTAPRPRLGAHPLDRRREADEAAAPGHERTGPLLRSRHSRLTSSLSQKYTRETRPAVPPNPSTSRRPDSIKPFETRAGSTSSTLPLPTLAVPRRRKRGVVARGRSFSALTKRVPKGAPRDPERHRHVTLRFSAHYHTLCAL